MIYVYYTQIHKESKELAEEIFSRFYSIDYKCLVFEKNGKPYLKGNPLFFSISHSNTMTAIAISEEEIGLDCEFNLQRERTALLKRLSIYEKNEDFYENWTAKESYIKMNGSSLASEWNHLKYYQGKIYNDDTPNSTFLQHFFMDNFTFCLCSKTKQNFCLINLQNIAF